MRSQLATNLEYYPAPIRCYIGCDLIAWSLTCRGRVKTVIRKSRLFMVAEIDPGNRHLPHEIHIPLSQEILQIVVQASDEKSTPT